MKLSEKEKTLYDAMSDIDDEYIEDAFAKPHRPIRNTVIRWSALACILALVFSLQALLPYLAPDSGTPSYPSSPSESVGRKPPLTLEEIFRNGGLFAITAYAAGTEEEVVYNLNSTFRNFVDVPENERQEFEGVDVLFSFFIHRLPENMYDFDLIYEYDDVVSVNRDTDHIHGMDVAYQDENGEWQGKIYITGWFNKPTDFSITMFDSDNNQVLQKMTMHIEFDEEENVYLLTVTEHFVYEGGNLNET